MDICTNKEQDVSGEFVTIAGERFYVIRNVDNMPAFFMSLISDSDHWLFVSSTGGLTAGRVSPETALFPYVPVDRVHESHTHTGCKTLLKITKGEITYHWEPFNKEHSHQYKISQNLYKNTLGDKVCFEEINYDLQMAFRYTWATSEVYGFCRQCGLENLGPDDISVQMIDGLQNILPAGTPRFTQSVSSNLVDAYKWNELNEETGLAMYTLYSGITDRAEPSESLRANTLFSTGLDDFKVLLCSEQLNKFKGNLPLTKEMYKRGVRGAYLVNSDFALHPGQVMDWQIIGNVEQSQCQVSALIDQLGNPDKLANQIEESIKQGSDALAKIMAAGDGFQLTNEENVSIHHYANTLFNNLRGGVFDNQYLLSMSDFIGTLKVFNQSVYEKHHLTLKELPKYIHISNLRHIVKSMNDIQLDRLVGEYLPITFGRRHGDPSRPWNQFSIKLKNDNGERLLSYEGNWRDIFQNWEALTFSYPEFVESVIAKFVNASTVDGYNPYRITKEGIDWEVEDPEDPWSYIGYWGDHQIIYLLKMLELSKQFHPEGLSEFLTSEVFSYANVPYRLKSFDETLSNAKDTVFYDEESAQRIAEKVKRIGADGKLILDENGEVYQVNLFEKLLVPLLCKLGNLVIDGGIWLNAQRPEWNDANNALVGQGLSMVTLNYLRRYICFFQDLVPDRDDNAMVSNEVVVWLTESLTVLKRIEPELNGHPISATSRFEAMRGLGLAACRYRQKVYKEESFSGKTALSLGTIRSLLDYALKAIEHSISTNLGPDGLYQAYNLLHLESQQAEVKSLYPMLEGQVAVLSSGAVSPEEAVKVLEALFDSDVYRPDQNSFMLYPDQPQVGFLDKNQISDARLKNIPVLLQMVQSGDESIVVKDLLGRYRFNPDIVNSSELNYRLDNLKLTYSSLNTDSINQIRGLYEHVFNHQAFTGRSGGMFGFEGLGCVYWHMVSKLLLSVKENFFAAVEQGAEPAITQRLGTLYYKVREGIGFNKSPAEYGAFPCDPYSHTPKHAGAQQPGMTGQVKEEILSRFGELGIHVHCGEVVFNPKLLRVREFVKSPQVFRYLDVNHNWQHMNVPLNGLAFTWCQVPIVYQLTDTQSCLTVMFKETREQEKQKRFHTLKLNSKLSHQLFSRSGFIECIHITINQQQLFGE